MKNICSDPFSLDDIQVQTFRCDVIDLCMLSHNVLMDRMAY